MLVPGALLTPPRVRASTTHRHAPRQANATVEGGKLALRWGDKVKHNFRRASEMSEIRKRLQQQNQEDAAERSLDTALVEDEARA